MIVYIHSTAPTLCRDRTMIITTIINKSYAAYSILLRRAFQQQVWCYNQCQRLRSTICLEPLAANADDDDDDASVDAEWRNLRVLQITEGIQREAEIQEAGCNRFDMHLIV